MAGPVTLPAGVLDGHPVAGLGAQGGSVVAVQLDADALLKMQCRGVVDGGA